MLIPEIDLELVEGTLGGRFTTVEGLLVQVKDQVMLVEYIRDTMYTKCSF